MQNGVGAWYVVGLILVVLPIGMLFVFFRSAAELMWGPIVLFGRLIHFSLVINHKDFTLGSLPCSYLIYYHFFFKILKFSFQPE